MPPAHKLPKELETANISYKKYIFKDKELVPDEKTLGSLMMAFPRDCDVIIAIGSGTLNDLCKFSSFQLGLDYMVLLRHLPWMALYPLELPLLPIM